MTDEVPRVLEPTSLLQNNVYQCMVATLKKLKCPHCGNEFLNLKGGFVPDVRILATCPECGHKFLPINRNA